MALQCLSIIGNKNEPLYFCTAPDNGKKDNTKTRELDPFGFLESLEVPETNSVQQEVSLFFSSLLLYLLSLERCTDEMFFF